VTVIGNLRNLKLSAGIQYRADEYTPILTDEQRMALQLDLWNVEWQRLINHVPFYRRMIKERGLPRRFLSWEEFIRLMPITTRALIQKKVREMTSNEHHPDFSRMTGGSTAEPIQLPAWNSEQVFTSYDMWLGRSWYTISPASRLFLLWGHSHLMGSGVRGWFNARKRNFFDSLLGYCRFSAYDLKSPTLQQAAREVIRFNPEYMIGYSVALDCFARSNEGLRDTLRKVGQRKVSPRRTAFRCWKTFLLRQLRWSMVPWRRD
jgi:phenylacetate-coenzyme A ligase PaaK-like adenylate-forming protein